MKFSIHSVRSALSRGLRGGWSYARSHKLIAAIAAVVIVGGGYWAYAAHSAKTTTTQYVLASVTQEPIESTVTASGEVAADHQLDLSPKASGEVTGVYVKAGDQVKAGQLLVSIDSTDAEKTVRDAELSLESAEISYTQSITSAKNTLSNSATSVSTARDNGFDAVTNAETSLATITSGLTTVLRGSTDLSGYGGMENNIAYDRLIQDTEPTADATRQATMDAYETALDSYNETFAEYQSASRSSSPEDIAALIAKVQDTASKVNQAVKDAQAYYQLVSNTVSEHDLLANPPSLASQVTSLNGYVSSSNSVSSSLQSAQSSLTSALQSYSSNTQSINGGTPLDVQSAELSLAKAKQSLADAQDALADYSVRAPFDGTVAEVDVQKFDQSGSKVATLITNESYASITLNEADIASVKAGEPVTLTFDAIEGLTIPGTVAQVNQVGTVSQGVTTYTVKIGFDTQDARVKPGMTVNASIVTASKQDAFVVPSSAVKTANGESYVEVAVRGSASSTPETPAMNGSFGGGMGSSTRAFRTGGMDSSSAARGGFASSSRAGAGSGFGSSSAFSRGETVPADSVTIRRVPVTTGIVSDTMTEITSGVTVGEQVVSQSLNASGASTASSGGGLFGLFGGSRRTTTGAAGAGATVRSTNASFGGARPAGDATFRAGGGGGFGG